jgi:hypothetical protein
VLVEISSCFHCQTNLLLFIKQRVARKVNRNLSCQRSLFFVSNYYLLKSYEPKNEPSQSPSELRNFVMQFRSVYTRVCQHFVLTEKTNENQMFRNYPFAKKTTKIYYSQKLNVLPIVPGTCTSHHIPARTSITTKIQL